MNTAGYRGISANMDDTGLKAYWKFDDATTPVVNSSQSVVDLGTAADLDMTGATFVSGGGIIDNSWDFDGTDDKGVAGTSTSQFDFLHYEPAGVPKWTINWWVKSNNATWATTQGIFYTSSTASDFGIVIIGLSNNALLIEINDGAGDNVFSNSFTSQMQDDTNWHMYTLRYEHSLGSNNMVLRRDGANEVAASKTATAPASGAHLAGQVGLRPDGAHDLDGDLDEMSIWERIWTDTEVTDSYNSGSGLEIYP